MSPNSSPHQGRESPARPPAIMDIRETDDEEEQQHLDTWLCSDGTRRCLRSISFFSSSS